MGYFEEIVLYEEIFDLVQVTRRENHDRVVSECVDKLILETQILIHLYQILLLNQLVSI